MNVLMEYLNNIKRSVLSITEGMAVTTSYLMRKPCTIQYPDRTARPVVEMLPERSRGFLEVDMDLCTGCTLCAKTCPIDCIHIDVAKNEETKQRSVTRFDIDIGKCMYCGLCEEACPTSAIRHSHEFEGGMADVNRFMLHFVTTPKPVAKPAKKDEPVNTRPKGTFVRPMLADPWKSAGPKGEGSST